MALKEYDFDKEPTVSVVKKILTDSVKMKATDIHFDPQDNELLIRFRINGNLVEYTTAPENVKANIITRIKILANMNITESLLPQIGAISFDVEGKSTNMRVSSLPVSNGEKVVVHLSNYAKNIKSISKIGFNPNDVDEIKKLLKEPQGIILITGTASSGKTTTMYSLIKEINNKSVNIISIEDPIKMKIEGVNQVQIAPEKGLTYKNLLRNVLLQDPNIICISELVDDETARSALRASITGRLVLSTMHTKNAFTTIDTLLNMDVENYLLGSNLVGIISQRLVKRLCPNCREQKKVSDYEKNIIKYILNEDVEEIYYPKGCTDCQNGYVDQLPIIEVVTIDDELRSAISNNKNRELIRNIIYANSNSILKDGFEKVIAGETSFDEIIRITDIKIDFTKDEQQIKDYILGNGETEFNIDFSKKKDEEKQEEPKEETENKPKDEEEKTDTSKNEDKTSVEEKETSTDNKETKSEETTTEVPQKVEIDKEESQIIKALSALENESKEKVEEQNKEAKKDEIEITIKPIDISSNENKTTDEKQNTTEENNNTEEDKSSNIFNDDDDEDDFNYNNSYSIF